MTWILLSGAFVLAYMWVRTRRQRKIRTAGSALN
jgi:hypothetical protein